MLSITSYNATRFQQVHTYTIRRPHLTMFLRVITRNIKQLTPNLRTMSTMGPLIDLKTDNEGISIMTLQRPPINKINLEMLQEMSQTLDELEKYKSNGLIITSSCPSVFSAGLDVNEFYKPDLRRAEEFWRTLQDVYYKIFGANFATAAAINGHSPAGGCLLSISTEYRVMVDGEYTIGLNETALGLVAPRWFIEAFCYTIPIRQAEYALTTGKLFTVDEALKVGLIDETASDKVDAIKKCKSYIRKFDDIPSVIRSITKRRIRETTLNKFQERREKDVQEFLELLNHPKLQQAVEAYITGLNNV